MGKIVEGIKVAAKVAEIKIVEGIKVAAKVAEIVMASAIVIELVGKWCGKSKTASVETVVDEATETD